MKTIIIWLIAVIVVVGGLIYIWDKPASMPIPVGGAATSTVATSGAEQATYFCSEGQVNATFSNAQVVLALADGRSLTLPQTVSGSGIRYASADGNTVFSGKGANATLTENGKDTYTNCLAGHTSASMSGGPTTLFEDNSHTFSFAYPSAFRLSGGDIGYTQGWSNNSTTSGLVLAVVTVPKSFEPGTNFSEAKMTVGVSSDPSAIAICTAATNGGKTAGNVSINGTVFAKTTLSDAGAGNLYDTTSYHTVRSGECYAVEYTIHSTQIANYPASAGIKAFDKTAVQDALEGIVRSFTFL